MNEIQNNLTEQELEQIFNPQSEDTADKTLVGQDHGWDVM